MASRRTNILWFACDKLVKAGTNMVIMLLLARYGPELFGQFNYAFMMGMLLYTITAVGNESYTIAQITERPEMAMSILGAGFNYRLRILGLSLFAYCVFLLFAGVNETFSWWLVLLALPALSETVEAYYQYSLKIKLAVIPRSVVSLIAFVFKLWIVLKQWPLVWLAAIYGAEALVIAMVVALVFWSKGKPSSAANRKIVARFNPATFATASTSLLLATIAAVLYTRVDTIVLEQLSSPKELGHFTFAARMAEAFYFLPLGISGSFMAGFVSSVNAVTGAVENPSFVKKYVYAILSVAISCAGIVMLAGTLLIHFYLGKRFGDGKLVLINYAACIPLVAIGLMINQYLVIIRQQKVVLYRYLLGFLLNLILNLLLVPAFAASGAAAATLLSYFLVNVGHLFISPLLSPLRRIALKQTDH